MSTTGVGSTGVSVDRLGLGGIIGSGFTLVSCFSSSSLAVTESMVGVNSAGSLTIGDSEDSIAYYLFVTLVVVSKISGETKITD